MGIHSEERMRESATIISFNIGSITRRPSAGGADFSPTVQMAGVTSMASVLPTWPFWACRGGTLGLSETGEGRGEGALLVHGFGGLGLFDLGCC